MSVQQPSTSSTASREAFRLERSGPLGILWFDYPGEKVNKFSSWAMAELADRLTAIAGMSDMTHLLIASAKPGIFIAGADVTEFGKVESQTQAEEFVRFGQRTLLALSRLPQITVAVIHGACMGGGTELALNCDYRVISDDPKSVMALPEVNLGIIPAWTGTSKLPRRVGLPAALDMILTGKKIDGRRGKKMGLVDEVIPEAVLMESAKSWALRQTRKNASGGQTKLLVEGNPLARKVIFSKARQSVMEKTGGHYPAPLEAIRVMELSFSKGIEASIDAEARTAAALIMGSVAQNLVRLFFLMEDAKKSRGPEPRAIRVAGVLGAGVMGGGIAQLIADKTSASVRMKDIAWPALAGGMKAASKIWKKKVDRRRMKPGEMMRKLARISTTTDWTGFEKSDIAIEAVVEKLEIKQSVLAEYEAISRPDAIFASNTSTIPITQIAARASRPGNVVGMHFFNPVDRMPLVEVIAGEKSSPEALSTVADFARKMGKTVVLCKDGPGFVVNRILAPYINEAVVLLEDGNSIESIDKAMKDFGMPMGPMALLDEVGIDVGGKAAHVLAEAFGDRMSAPQALEKFLADQRYGKKNGRGVYVWKDGKREGADPAVYELIGVTPRPQPMAPEAMVERMVLIMVNEASRVLDEGIVASAAELDLAMIMGTGFPPFRGGLLRYADERGAHHILARLEALEREAGARFAPSATVRKLGAEGSSFYRMFPGNEGAPQGAGGRGDRSPSTSVG